MDISQLAEVIGTVLAAVATVAAISLPALKKLHAAVTTARADVMHELKPNSGSSLRDAVDRIEKQQALQAQAFTDRVAAVDARLHRLESAAVVRLKGRK